MWDPTEPAKKRKRILGAVTLPKNGFVIFDEQKRFALTTLARQYEILSEDKSGIRCPEMLRILVVIGITPEATVGATTRLAVRTNVKALIASYGARLPAIVGAKGVRRDVRESFPKNVQFSMDAPLGDQLSVLVPYFRTKNNKGMLHRIVNHLVDKALHDPRLHQVLRAYAPIVNQFHAELVAFSKRIGDVLAKMAGQMSDQMKELG
jgi:hypothetical protein